MDFLKRVFDFFIRWYKNPVFLIAYACYYFQSDFRAGTKFFTEKEFVEEMKKGRSFVRLLDGETHIINGQDLAYQKYEKRLANSMRQMIKEYTDDSPYVIGLAAGFLNKTNRELKKDSMFYVWLPAKVTFKTLFNKKAKYGDGHAFYRDGFFVRNMESVLLDKHLLVVTNAKSIEAFKNNKAIPFKKFSFVETPSTNSYEKYDKIFSETLETVSKIPKEEKPVIVFSTGPASKQLVYEFSKLGYTSYDLGRGFEVLYTDVSLEDVSPALKTNKA